MALGFGRGIEKERRERKTRGYEPFALHELIHHALLGVHAGLYVGVFQKSILSRVCQLLAIRAHKMAPRTS